MNSETISHSCQWDTRQIPPLRFLLHSHSNYMVFDRQRCFWTWTGLIGRTCFIAEVCLKNASSYFGKIWLQNRYNTHKWYNTNDKTKNLQCVTMETKTVWNFMTHHDKWYEIETCLVICFLEISPTTSLIVVWWHYLLLGRSLSTWTTTQLFDTLTWRQDHTFVGNMTAELVKQNNDGVCFSSE